MNIWELWNVAPGVWVYKSFYLLVSHIGSHTYSTEDRYKMTTLTFSLKRMHHLLYPSSPPPADRHYLKLWSAFVGVSPSQNHRLPTNQLDTNGGTIYKQHSQNGWIYFETSAAASFVLERGVPQRLLAFGALIVDFPDPPLGVAYAAAPPVEWRGANVPRLSFPFAICSWRQVMDVTPWKHFCTLRVYEVLPNITI